MFAKAIMSCVAAGEDAPFRSFFAIGTSAWDPAYDWSDYRYRADHGPQVVPKRQRVHKRVIPQSHPKGRIVSSSTSTYPREPIAPASSACPKTRRSGSAPPCTCWAPRPSRPSRPSGSIQCPALRSRACGVRKSSSKQAPITEISSTYPLVNSLKQ